MTNQTLNSELPKPNNRIPIREHLRCFIGNIPAWPTMLAFRILRRAMRKDPGWAWSWHCNIAMASYDAGWKDHAGCNLAAARFMKNCFGVDTTEHPK